MKRFFCTTCQRIKRVRRFPADISNPNAVSQFDRIGTCDYHTLGHFRAPRKEFIRPTKTPKTTEIKSNRKKAS